jgi:hypothetical protein
MEREMIEDWIDDVVTLFQIADGRGGMVKAYWYYDGLGLPDAINEYPCAIVIPENVLSVPSAGLKIDYWRGRVEFHLFEDVGWDKLPEIMKYARRIRDAMATGVSLSSKVDEFRIDPDRPRILIPTQLRWDENQPWHWGAILYWEVKEDVSSEYSYTA